MTSIDIPALRSALYPLLVDGGHKDIAARFRALGVIEPEHESEYPPSKAQRVAGVLRVLPDAEVPRVAEQLLREADYLAPGTRIAVQDLLWAGQGPVIVERTRRELADDLDIEDLAVDADRLLKVLARWWDIDSGDALEGWIGNSPTLRTEVRQHVFRNSDWSASELFDRLGAYEAVDRRFAGFLQDLVSHQAVIHETNQRRIVAALTPHLNRIHLDLREEGTENGYPVFRLVPTGTPAARTPKSIVFASTRKPDLRVSSVVDNEIEIVNNGSDVLVYDQPIGSDGLRWRDLHAWWQRHHPEQDTDTAKNALYRRLRLSLPENSPPQQILFQLYHEIHRGHIYDLPALLPEVWLHWDHRTVAQRGVRALLGQRMDFLLLRGRYRIVLEVDGATHYTDRDGNPSPAEYARNTRMDRSLRLRGYEVFRFGASELRSPEQAAPLLTNFFEELFDRFPDHNAS